MDEIFSINFDGYKTDTEYVSISKVRLWPRILAATSWLMRKGIPGQNLILDGTGLLIINNLAIAMEGFVADMIVQKIDTHEENKPKEIIHIETSADWNDKFKYYNQFFETKLYDYSEFKSVEILFVLRDNLLHGLTHSEETRTNISTGARSNIKSQNQKYQRARKFFVKNGLLKDTDSSSNVNVFWKLEIVAHLFWQVQKLMLAILRDNNSPTFLGISNELNTCLFEVEIQSGG